MGGFGIQSGSFHQWQSLLGRYRLRTGFELITFQDCYSGTNGLPVGHSTPLFFSSAQDSRHDAVVALKDKVMQIGGCDRPQGGKFGRGIGIAENV